MCSCAAVVNSLGLGLDIVGVILFFLFGLPKDVRRDGASYCPCARSKTTDFESVRLQQPSGWAGGRSA